MRIHQPKAVLLGTMLAFGWLLPPIPSMAQRKGHADFPSRFAPQV